MSTTEVKEDTLKINNLLKLKDRLEDHMWFYKSIIVLGQATSFAIMFGLFGENPKLYRQGVWLGVICILLDFALNYRDYSNQKKFQLLTEG